MAKIRLLNKLSLKWKVILTLLMIPVLVLAVSLSYTVSNERDLILQFKQLQVEGIASSYFDGLNTLMMTGNMASRGLLRDKLLAQPDIKDIRVLRGAGVIQAYGKGTEDEVAQDALDKRAMGGETVVSLTSGDDGRILTFIKPMRADQESSGVKCISCHQVPPETVLGAIRIDYSLAAMDARVHANLFKSGGIQLLIYLFAIFLILVVLRQIIIRPIDRLKQHIQAVEHNADLTERMPIENEDEIGAVASAVNSMLTKFHHSLEGVANSTHQLSDLAQRVSAVSEETVSGVLEQRMETDQVATAMNEMNATVQEVALHAGQTAESSREVDQEAKDGALIATEAIGGIDALLSEVTAAAEVINRLDAKSVDIGAVLDVIRGIAEQTNLLALNAAIEAARAGEQGRGFAVVADEVRTLASRTQKSTEEIQGMIEGLQGEARQAVSAMESAKERALAGTEQVEKAAESLAMIAGGVGTINDMNTQIAHAADQQSEVADEINRNINNISQIADKTSEGAKQTAQASDDLVQLAEQLQSLVRRFKL